MYKHIRFMTSIEKLCFVTNDMFAGILSIFKRQWKIHKFDGIDRQLEIVVE